MANVCLHCGLPVPSYRMKRDRRQSTGSSGSHQPIQDQFCCSGCRFVYQMMHAAEDIPEGKSHAGNLLILRLGMGIFLGMNLMAFNWLFYSGHIFGFEWSGHGGEGLASLFAWLMLLIATIVLVLLGVPLFLSQWQLVRRQGFKFACNTHMLILLGVTAAYGLSAWQTVQGALESHLYFDTAAMTLMLVTLGAYLDARSRTKAMRSTEAVMHELPDICRRLKCLEATECNAEIESVSICDIRIGDRLLVSAGETIPVDGEIIRGQSFIQEAHLTGEAKPRSAGKGDWLHAGSVTVDGELMIVARRVGASRLAAQITELLTALKREQSPLQGLADRVTRIFLPGVVGLAAATFIYWYFMLGFESALLNSLSVLLISCPCALGLASPLATFSALKEASGHGIIFRSPVVLEKLHQVRTAFFDKTGTLTRRKLELQSIDMTGAIDVDSIAWQEALGIAAEMERGMPHVIAQSIVHAADHYLENIPPIHALSKKTIPGMGVKMLVREDKHEMMWYLGSARLVKEMSEEKNIDAMQWPTRKSFDELKDEHPLCIYLFTHERVYARFSLVESLRYTARDTMVNLKVWDVKPAVISGDQPPQVQRVAEALGIAPLDRHAACLPQDKVAVIQKEQANHIKCALVGDGMNDAPALAASDVGMVMAHAPDLSQDAGDIYLLQNDLMKVSVAIQIARKVMSRIKLNLCWAFGYNLIGLSLAVTGCLSPLFAGSAMLFSSLLIILTSNAPYLSKDEMPEGDKTQYENVRTKTVGESVQGVQYA